MTDQIHSSLAYLTPSEFVEAQLAFRALAPLLLNP